MLAYENGAVRVFEGKDPSAKEHAQFKKGLFYMGGGGRHVGFLTGHGDYVRFRNWRNGDYTALYKVLVEKQLKKAGETSESRGISCWGESRDEIDRLFKITEAIRLDGKLEKEKLNDHEKAVARFVGQAVQLEGNSENNAGKTPD